MESLAPPPGDRHPADSGLLRSWRKAFLSSLSSLLLLAVAMVMVQGVEEEVEVAMEEVEDKVVEDVVVPEVLEDLGVQWVV